VRSHTTVVIVMLRTVFVLVSTALQAQPSTLLPRTVSADALPTLVDEASALSELLAIMPLREHAAGAGDREVRLWYGAIGRWPQAGIVVAERASTVTVRAVRYWPTLDITAGALAERDAARRQVYAVRRIAVRGQCRPLRATVDVAGCEVVPGRDADGVLAALDSLDVWALPDEADFGRRLPMAARGGWQLRVEVREGTRYRRVQWTNADRAVGAASAPARQVVALAQLVDVLAMPAVPGPPR
jgi:hypothetical protein